MFNQLCISISDSKSKLAADESIVYGPAGCCYKPCFVTSDSPECPHPGNIDCPLSGSISPLNSTSNSTTSGANAHGANAQNLGAVFLSVFVSSFVVHSARYRCIGLT